MAVRLSKDHPPFRVEKEALRFPSAGWAITAANLVTIGYKTTRKYNSIVKPEDRISYSRIAYGGR